MKAFCSRVVFFIFRIKMKKEKAAFYYSILGMLSIGFGLSLLGEAIIMKIQQGIYWIPLGTLALTVTNTGICFIGKAILLKAKD